MRLPLILCALALSSLGVATVALDGVAGVRAEETALLQPTPLILKDGRIANVSVHVLPFATGRVELGGEIARRLADLTGHTATDCFLTAQVIGHVAPGEVTADDTLSAHRIARSRADAVQAALIEAGLPARSIASVWDWQFMVHEARATLWMFRLTPGEDCEDTPLEGVAARVAAVTPPPATTPDATATSPSTGLVGQANAATRAQDAPEAAGGATSDSGLRTMAAGPAPAPREPLVTRPVQASNPAPETERRLAPASAKTLAALPEKEADAPERRGTGPTTPRGRVAALDGDVLAITFPTNSSYFPPGTTERLDKLIGDHAQKGPYRIQIDVGVSGSDRVIGAKSQEEAAQYNRWLAERRLERVRGWLDEHAAGEFEIEPAFHENDDSRQLVVRVASTG